MHDLLITLISISAGLLVFFLGLRQALAKIQGRQKEITDRALDVQDKSLEMQERSRAVEDEMLKLQRENNDLLRRLVEKQ